MGVMETLVSDVRYGFRLLLQKPGAAAIAILTLAIGIGATTAIFSVINGVLLRPLPYNAPDELVMVWQDHTRVDGPATEWVSPDNFFDWREQNQVFDGMFALGGWRPTLSGVDEPEHLNGARASHDVFSILDVEPMLGRGFTAEEDRGGEDLVVVLAHSLWQRRFGGSRDVLGTVVTLDGKPATVVGVMPPDLDFPIIRKPEIFAPLQIDRSNSCGRGCVTLRVVARLEDGSTFERARSNMDAIAGRLEREYPEDNVGVGVTLVPLHEQIVGPMRAALLVLLGAVGLVLLIACANVANLMLARAAEREREVATRIAMGASRARLFRQFLTESLLLAMLGSFAGLVLALWGVDLLLSLIPESVPRFSEVSVDGRALAFTWIVAAATGLAFGLVPAVRASKPNLQVSLKEGVRGSSGGSTRFRSGLVVVEAALAIALLVGAGLLMRSFQSLMRVDPGFDATNLLTVQLNLAGPAYETRESRVAFVERLTSRVNALPGVEGAGVIYVLPMGGDNADTGFLIEGREQPRPGQTPVAWYRPVSPEYLTAIKMRLVRGRWFRDTDAADTPQVVLINETAARRYWPDEDEDPLLSTVRLAGASRRVIGVIADTKHFGLDQAARPAMYFPYAQLPTRSMSLVVRSGDAPENLVPAVRSAVWELDPGLALSKVATMEAVISDTVAEPRVVTMLLALFAASALVLAAIGFYGVMSYTVRQRAREIGIRMALGARSGDVLRQTVGRGLLLTGVGAAAGLLGAFFLTRFMESLLFDVTRTDPLTFVAGLIVLEVVAVLACYIPARRAANVDPVVALRHE